MKEKIDQYTQCVMGHSIYCTVAVGHVPGTAKLVEFPLDIHLLDLYTVWYWRYYPTFRMNKLFPSSL
jgi:hypothetical protein